MEKTSFLIYVEWAEIIDSLSDEQAGKLFKLIFEYHTNQSKTELDEKTGTIFQFMKIAFDKNQKKYIEKCEKNKANIKKRWEKAKENTIEYERIQPYTNYTDNDSDSDNDNGSDNDNDIYIYQHHEKIDYKNIINTFNEICISLPKVEKITDKRKRGIKTLLKTLDNKSIKEFFEIVEKSDYLTNRFNKNSWQCNFDWLLNQNNAIKVIEGNYNNKNQNQSEIINMNYEEGLFDE